MHGGGGGDAAARELPLQQPQPQFRYRAATGCPAQNSKTTRRRRGRTGTDGKCSACSGSVDAVQALVKSLEAKKQALSATPFYAAVRDKCIASILDTAVLVEQIVCYGIGSPANSQRAQRQLALAFLLRDALKPSGGMQVFDPVMDESDKGALDALGAVVVPENEEAKRTVSGRTIFYMPHCERELYNNVISANWEPKKLVDVVIIGNCFDVYTDKMSDAELREKAPYIRAAAGRAKTLRLPDELFEDGGVFNDTCLHTFPPGNVPADPADVFWAVPTAGRDNSCEDHEGGGSSEKPGRRRGRNGPIEAARAVARGER